jgi:dipeptidyl-peptidase-4
MKSLLVCVSFALSFFTLSAQDTTLSLSDAVLQQWRKFAPERIPGLQWAPGRNAYTYINSNADKLLIRQVDDSVKTLLSKEDLANATGIADINLRTYRWLASNQILFTDKHIHLVITLAPLSVFRRFELPENAENTDISPSGMFMAFTQSNNLFLHDGTAVIQITEEPEGVVCGQTVHRNEFGIYKGTFWSNKGDRLAFYRKDERMVDQYPLIDYRRRPAQTVNLRYPMAGMTSEQVTVRIYNTADRQTTYIKTGSPAEQYLINPEWSPDDAQLLIGVLNRDQNFLKMNLYETVSGSFQQTLFEERDEKYVQPLHPPLFVPGKPDHFVWLSERDGYTHLYLYSTKGKMVRKLTGGEWTITELLGFDNAGNLHFIEAENRGLDRIHRAVDLKGKIRDITINRGNHSALFANGASAFIDVLSSTEIPMRYTLYGCDGSKKEVLKESVNTYAQLQISKPELGVLMTDGNIPLNYRLIKPFEFDPRKKYKTLLYVYNGPGVQLITNTWNAGAPLWMQWMANQGWVIMTVDGRGSENRGRDFEQAVFRNLGEYEVVDQLKAVEWLYQQPWADKNLMAVHGWSYGGFMTTSLMLKAPGIFKAGVAGGPVMDWKYYEVMYTERYMDTPETNPDGYARSSLLDKTDKLKGKLLVIHGADDDVVVPQHSIDFLKNTVEKGVQVDFFLYPGHKHNVMGKDRVHLIQKVYDYLEDNVRY